MKKEFLYKSPVVKVVDLQLNSSLMVSSPASGSGSIKPWEEGYEDGADD